MPTIATRLQLHATAGTAEFTLSALQSGDDVTFAHARSSLAQAIARAQAEMMERVQAEQQAFAERRVRVAFEDCDENPVAVHRLRLLHRLAERFRRVPSRSPHASRLVVVS
ncbi:MAG TPA: hypothetical protein VKF40_11605 [Burkholderiales bacterium]|nr:hypothetical protein [Burkholderiales bacterium]